MTAPGGVRPLQADRSKAPIEEQESQLAGLPIWMIRGRGHGERRVLSERHSQLVRQLKIGLPLVALALVALVASWPYIIAAQLEPSKIDKSQTTMVNPRYLSRDKQNRPFSLNAKTATVVPGANNLVDLVQLEGEVTQANNSWVTVSSERGRYNQDDGRLLMLDKVHLLRDDGFEFFTDEAEIDTKTGNAWGNHPVTGHGPNGEIHADGFVATDYGKTITFKQSSSARVLATPSPQPHPTDNGPPQ